MTGEGAPAEAHSGPGRVAGQPPLELWGGVECTLNRVHDVFLDQLERSGHLTREGDLDLFAGLGIRALRYPVLWERVQPAGEEPRWEWPDARLARIRELGLRPVVGLVHHGSGPRDTSLLDPAWPLGLARFARRVAERYPWVLDYTPVNEPLTTARFSGLYGLWYPHGRDPLLFARALIVQCRGVALAMRAIREVSPAARLVQTEDLARTHSTRALAYQAEFENERRWLTFDLLAGRVRPGHPMWDHLLWLGIEERELAPFLEEPCPPDLLGLNHYLTSERFLDERLERYPTWAHGGNGHHRYADVEAVRVLAGGAHGPAALLREAWDRYGAPIAVTEVHLGCTREEQLRWFMEVWQAVRRVRAEGVDVRAITCWSLLGAFDWCTLVTRPAGQYEPGAFDVRAPRPRPTALAALIRQLARRGDYDHPILDGAGWWRRPQRLAYPAAEADGEPTRIVAVAASQRPPRPVLVCGPEGVLARSLARACDARGLTHVRVATAPAEEDRLGRLVEEHKAWAVVNVGPETSLAVAEADPESCRLRIAGQAAALARACARGGAAFATFSSGLVFDGAAAAPYVETDLANPLNALGRALAEAERTVLEQLPTALVVRTGPLFGGDPEDVVSRMLQELARRRRFVAAGDLEVSPTSAPELAHAVLDLLVDAEAGVWHVANAGAVTWAEFARRVAQVAGLDPARVEARPGWAVERRARQPRRSSLASTRGMLLGSFEDALRRSVEDSRAARPIGRPRRRLGSVGVRR